MKSKWRNITVDGRKYKYATHRRDGVNIGVVAKHPDGDLYLSSLNMLRGIETEKIPTYKITFGCKPGVIGPAVVAAGIRDKLSEQVPVVRHKKGKKK